MDGEELLIYRKNKAADTIKEWPYEKVANSLYEIVDLPPPTAANWTPWDQSFYDFIEERKEGKFLVGNVGDNTWFLYVPAFSTSGPGAVDAARWFVISTGVSAKGIVGSRGLVALREVATQLGLI